MDPEVTIVSKVQSLVLLLQATLLLDPDLLTDGMNSEAKVLVLHPPLLDIPLFPRQELDMRDVTVLVCGGRIVPIYIVGACSGVNIFVSPSFTLTNFCCRYHRDLLYGHYCYV